MSRPQLWREEFLVQENQEGWPHCSNRDNVSNSGKWARVKRTDYDGGTVPGIYASLLTMLASGLVSIICIALLVRVASLLLQFLILIYSRRS
jgi:hypothetical protein